MKSFENYIDLWLVLFAIMALSLWQAFQIDNQDRRIKHLEEIQQSI